MRRFHLSQELPLRETEQHCKEQFLTFSDERKELDLISDINWLDAHARLHPNSTGNHRLLNIPGSRGKKLPFFLQRHDRYFLLHMHTHSWLEMLCVIHGSCAHRVGSATGTLQQGDVLMITPGTQHVFLAASDDCIIYNIYLPLDRFEQDFDAILRSQSVLSSFLLKTLYADGRDSYLIFHTGDYFLRENYLAELWQEYSEPGPFAAQRMIALQQLLFVELLQQQAQPITVSIDAPHSAGRDQMLIEYVRSHSDTVSVGELSQIFNYSERQITRIFQKATGMSCIDFIQQCRLEQFLSLLLTTDLSIVRMQELCGIRGTQQFYRSFKDRFGLSPMEYRQAARDSAQYRAEAPESASI